MTPRQLIKHFKTQTAAAAALRVTQPAVSNWLKRGSVPALQQLKAESITTGLLKADRKVKARVSQR